MKKIKKGESSSHPFTIKLASGKEEKFKNGFEMWSWVMRNKPGWLGDAEKSAEKVEDTQYGDMGTSR